MNIENINIKITNCLYVKSDQNWSLPERTNPYHKLIYFCKDGGEFIMNSKKYQAKKGSLLYSYPDLQHSAYSGKNNFMEYISIHFYVYGVKDEKIGKLNFEEMRSPLPISPISKLINSSIIESYYRRIFDIWSQKEYCYKMHSTGLFYQTIKEILLEKQYRRIPFQTIEKIKESVQYIRDNYRQEISIDTLLTLNGLSRSYFHKKFKEITGHTVLGYITLNRMEKAKEYLINSNMPIKEIANLVGYEDEFYFSRVFKKCERLSPLEYRMYH